MARDTLCWRARFDQRAKDHNGASMRVKTLLVLTSNIVVLAMLIPAEPPYIGALYVLPQIASVGGLSAPCCHSPNRAPRRLLSALTRA